MGKKCGASYIKSSYVCHKDYDYKSSSLNKNVDAPFPAMNFIYCIIFLAIGNKKWFMQGFIPICVFIAFMYIAEPILAFIYVFIFCIFRIFFILQTIAHRGW